MRQTSYKSIAKTTSPPVTAATPRTPIYRVGAIRESDYPEALEGACPEVLEGLAPSTIEREEVHRGL